MSDGAGRSVTVSKQGLAYSSRHRQMLVTRERLLRSDFGHIESLLSSVVGHIESWLSSVVGHKESLLSSIFGHIESLSVQLLAT